MGGLSPNGSFAGRTRSSPPPKKKPGAKRAKEAAAFQMDKQKRGGREAEAASGQVARLSSRASQEKGRGGSWERVGGCGCGWKREVGLSGLGGGGWGGGKSVKKQRRDPQPHTSEAWART